MNTSPGRDEAESKIEDILLLYAADSIAAIDEDMLSNINWSGTAVKAAYRLGRSLGAQFNDISFNFQALDEAMNKGRHDQATLTNSLPEYSTNNIRYIAS